MIEVKLFITVRIQKYATGKLQHSFYQISSTNHAFFNFCSIVLIPGIALLPGGLLAISYALALVYLFLGIGIVSDVFMA